jgi:hypothetical protein
MRSLSRREDVPEGSEPCGGHRQDQDGARGGLRCMTVDMDVCECIIISVMMVRFSACRTSCSTLSAPLASNASWAITL